MPYPRRFALCIMSALILTGSLGCDSKKGLSLTEEDTARRAQVRELLTDKEQERIDDLFVPSLLMDEIVQPNKELAPREVVEQVVTRIKTLREEKGLALSTASAPSGSRAAAELARLLVSPSPIVKADLPTNDLELTVLAVATLRRHGIKASPAVQLAHSDDIQLEHVVLAVSFEGKPPEFFELTRDDVAANARFEVITEVELLGLHLARRAALLYLLDRKVMAKQDLDVAFKLAPDMATPYYVRASMTGDLAPKQAVSDISRVALRKDSPEIWLRLGRALRIQEKYKNAHVILAQIPRAHALYDEACMERAQIACARDDKDAFVLHVIDSISANPRRWEAYRDMAIVGAVHGDYEVVDEAIREGIRAAPNVPVWKTLSQASDPERPIWDEGLMTRRKSLGACAQDPPKPAQLDEPDASPDLDL